MSDQQEDHAGDNLSRVTDWLLVGGGIATVEHLARLAAHGITTCASSIAWVSTTCTATMTSSYDDQPKSSVCLTDRPTCITLGRAAEHAPPGHLTWLSSAG
jgi:hypothetical protein